jgi:hypothetical protein
VSVQQPPQVGQRLGPLAPVKEGVGVVEADVGRVGIRAEGALQQRLGVGVEPAGETNFPQQAEGLRIVGIDLEPGAQQGLGLAGSRTRLRRC